MQLVDNTYQIADGYFISNHVGASAFAAESLIFPPLTIIAGLGLMFGTGGAALIAQTMGEGDREKANRQLSMITVALAAVSVILSAVEFFLMPAIAGWVGADEMLIPYCVEYGRILAVCMPFQMLNAAFHPLMIVADRPNLGLVVSLINAAVNILLDWVLVALLGLDLTGAALATGLAWVVSALIPLWFFFRNRTTLRFSTFRFDLKDLGQTCYNGASEMVDAVSYAVVAILFNGRLLQFLGEYGVDAYAVSEYVSSIFLAVFFGIGMTVTPVVGYHLGQKNKTEIRSILKNGLRLNLILGLIAAVISFFSAFLVSQLFVGYDQDLLVISTEALRIISFGVLLFGLTTFSSAFFTGMEDGAASLAVALNKCLIFPLLGMYLLPQLFGNNGIWLVTPVAEFMTVIAAGIILLIYRKKQKI